MRLFSTIAIVLLGTFSYAFELAHFNIQPDKNQNVVLSWQTTNEGNNQYFEVEHSIDGRQFTTIGRLMGAARANISKKYKFIHQGAREGKHFYRLAQTKLSGAVVFSAIREVLLNPLITRQILIAANPIKGDVLNLKIRGNYSCIDFQLLTKDGEVVYSEKIFKRKHAVLIDMKEVRPGRYTYELFTPTGTIQKGSIELLY